MKLVDCIKQEEYSFRNLKYLSWHMSNDVLVKPKSREMCRQSGMEQCPSLETYKC